MSISSINLNATLTTQLELQKMQSENTDFEAVLQDAIASEDDETLKDACKQIEQYMLSSLFKQMKSSTEMGERLIPKGDYEEMFESYLVDEQCKTMCEAGGIGLADSMYKQMTGAYNTQQNYKK